MSDSGPGFWGPVEEVECRVHRYEWGGSRWAKLHQKTCPSRLEAAP